MVHTLDNNFKHKRKPCLIAHPDLHTDNDPYPILPGTPW